MTVDYIFITPNVYECGEVLPKDCTKKAIGLGAVPDEICDIYETPYYCIKLTPSTIEWVFSDVTPIVFS